MSDSLVLRTASNGVVTLTLNRPDRRNALSRDLIKALLEAFQSVADDPEARVVILTGVGTVFCAGMDLAELQSSLEATPDKDTHWEDARILARLFEMIYRLPIPTIAAVNGTAVAGGAGLVCVCDLAIAVEEAKFGYPEVRRGLVAAIVMPHLMRHVGERMARYLLLSGDLISANAAASTGLINEVVSRDRFERRIGEWTRSLIEGGPVALKTTKKMIEEFSSQTWSLEELAKSSAAPRLNKECQEGLRAFFDKKPAPWIPTSH